MHPSPSKSYIDGSQIGYTEISYNRADVELLQECLDFNQGSLSMALKSFINDDDSLNDLLFLWLPLAEKLKENPRYILETYLSE